MYTGNWSTYSRAEFNDDDKRLFRVTNAFAALQPLIPAFVRKSLQKSIQAQDNERIEKRKQDRIFNRDNHSIDEYWMKPLSEEVASTFFRARFADIQEHSDYNEHKLTLPSGETIWRLHTPGEIESYAEMQFPLLVKAQFDEEGLLRPGTQPTYQVDVHTLYPAMYYNYNTI